MKKKFYKKAVKLVAIVLSACSLLSVTVKAESREQRGTHPESTIETASFDVDCRSAILVEANTNTVLYEKNADEALFRPYQVDKIKSFDYRKFF